MANYMRPASPIATLPASAASSIHVDDFTIDYRPDGSVAQFYSTLTLTDPQVRTECGSVEEEEGTFTLAHLLHWTLVCKGPQVGGHAGDGSGAGRV